MKQIILAFSVPIFIFFSSHGYGQEIDSSVMQNLSQEQIAIAKEFLDKDNIQAPIEEDSSEVGEESLRNNDECEGKNCELDKTPFASYKKFGYDFISTSPTSIVATGDLPLPNEYKISLGDVISVVLSGSKKTMFDMRAQLDGTVFFPELGSISVAGESFQDVKNKLNNLIEQSYIGVSIDLSLKNLSAKKITIVGAVNNPGTYLVNPFTTISNSLAYSGGIQEIGSLRNIRLIRSNGDNFSFDLYDLLINGDRTNDITIESGDVILVGPATKFVNIDGMVVRPGLYEITENEDLSDLINYAMGFKGGANIEKITLDKLDSQSLTLTKVITKDISYNLKDIVQVQIYSYKNDISSSINVSGAVEQPGFYNLEDYDDLEQLIDALNFVDVYPWLAVLEQFDEDNLVKYSTLFSLKDPSTYRSIKLLPNSRVYFADMQSRNFNVSSMTANLIRDYDLTIYHKQGAFSLPVYGRYSVQSFIDYLGLDMSDVSDEATYISPLENIVIKDNYKNMQFSAQKYNTVTFRSPINDLISVSIRGAIDYPGTYALQSNTTLQQLYGMIGSFKDEAFFEGIIFTRRSIRDRQLSSIQKSKEDLNRAILTSRQKGENIGDISVISALSESIEPENLGRIAGDFAPMSTSSQNTILADGDTIIIPINPNAISVLGEVLNPIAFEYSKKISVRSAIDNAGGYKDYAAKRKVYVIKANGMVKKVNRNIFAKNVTLEPGDSIIVPRKIITNNPGVAALIPITTILSDLAFSAAALETLSNID